MSECHLLPSGRSPSGSKYVQANNRAPEEQCREQESLPQAREHAGFERTHEHHEGEQSEDACDERVRPEMTPCREAAKVDPENSRSGDETQKGEGRDSLVHQVLDEPPVWGQPRSQEATPEARIPQPNTVTNTDAAILRRCLGRVRASATPNAASITPPGMNPP